MKKLMIIDGNSLLNRAFYGLPMLNAPDGTPTNAVLGFLKILNKLRKDEMPDAMLVAFDRPEPTFRHKKEESYKATRKGMPDDLAVQLPIMKDALDAMKIARAELAGYEADDIIGTVSGRCDAWGYEAVIVTGDRDSLQLISDSVRVLLVKTSRGMTETIDYSTVRFVDEYCFAPIYLIDLKALMGDSSDNIKGVRGIGEKTALDLIREFGSLDGVYANIDKIKESTRKKLEEGREDAYQSYTLATIARDAPIAITIEDTILRNPDEAALSRLFAKLGFVKLIAEMNLPMSDEKQERVLTIPDGVDPDRICVNLKDLLRDNLFESPAGTQVLSLFPDEAAQKTGTVKGGIEADKCDFDLALAAYLINPTEREYSFDKICKKYLGSAVQEADSDAAKATLRVMLEEKLRETNVDRLFYDIEMPMCYVLADMEAHGVLVDRNALSEYGAALAVKIQESEQTIYAMAGGAFNIGSPKQLGEVLFEKLKMPAGKKTKTGYSTSADVLDRLEPDYPIITAIKEYRELTKLRSTYAEGLLKVIREDGRIHTSFQMMATATGRLSSTEPNLQNIPIRKPMGEKFRHMFIAPPSRLLIDADYSQIELRILAHIAGDSAMVEAFRSGEDFHTFTAGKVFGVPYDNVTKEQRSSAKAVNFGIVYGISAFSLSRDIGVSVAEAKDYIDAYLERFSGVRAYMTDIVERAKRDGYVTTLFGRRRQIPELSGNDRNIRAFGERVALNMPIQGTAADIMKIAMVRAYRNLKDKTPDAHMILQVHDELIIESSEHEAESARDILTEAMENAASLTVPLKVESGIGKTWAECK